MVVFIVFILWMYSLIIETVQMKTIELYIAVFVAGSMTFNV